MTAASSNDVIYVNDVVPVPGIYYNDDNFENNDEAKSFEESTSSAYVSELYLNAIAQTNRVPMMVSGEDESYFDQELNDLENESDNDDETNYALFSDIMSYFNNTVNATHAHNTSKDLMLDGSVSSYFSMANNEHSLDYTPVKGDCIRPKDEKPVSKKLHYAPLKIDPVNLPAVGSQQEPGTAVASHRKRFAPKINPETASTPIATRTAQGFPQRANNYNNNNNNGMGGHSKSNPIGGYHHYSSDTDSSLHAPCCSVNPLKIKW